MLEIRRASENELKDKIDISNFNLDNTLFILEKGNVLGYASFEIKDFYGKLIKLEVEDKLLKDGLMRSVINAMDYRGIEYFVAEKNEDEGIYKLIGFKDVGKDNIFHLEAGKYIYMIVKELFEHKCPGCQK